MHGTVTVSCLVATKGTSTGVDCHRDPGALCPYTTIPHRLLRPVVLRRVWLCVVDTAPVLGGCEAGEGRVGASASYVSAATH